MSREFGFPHRTHAFTFYSYPLANFTFRYGYACLYKRGVRPGRVFRGLQAVRKVDHGHRRELYDKVVPRAACTHGAQDDE